MMSTGHPSTFQRQAHRSILKAAVQHSMFNEDGTVADVRRSVLLEVLIPATMSRDGISKGEAHAMSLYSGTAFDSMPDLRATVANLPEGSVVEVWDGRLLSKASGTGGYLKLSNIGGALVESDTL